MKHNENNFPNKSGSSRIIADFSKRVIDDIIKDPLMREELITLISKLLKDKQTTDNVIELLIKAVKNEYFVNDAIDFGKKK